MTVCTIGRLGGRHIAAMYRTGSGNPGSAVRTVLDTLVARNLKDL